MLKTACGYGRDVAMEFSTVEDAWSVDGTELPTPYGPTHVIRCKRNRTATAQVYKVMSIYIDGKCGSCV